ncbi:MAG: cobyrinate a,c-diamide synthase [Deferrisomatales bacterium]|nr:cobyrinate a,c-diamide synthase [Deferrisomatales bacterium]
MTSAFLLAAPHSGSGKTTCTLAILAALRARGLRVQAFKVGPDYIDPAHHAHITGRPSHNLDTWMLPAEANWRLFATAAADADVCVVEGVMGLFDGVDGRRPLGSSADLARQLGLPVVLVVDARSMARSAAALVHGFATFDPELQLLGVVWNRVGSANHRRILDESLATAGLPEALGALPRDGELCLAERHLGLVTPEDAAPTPAQVRRLAAVAEEHLDLDRLLAQTRRAVPCPPPAPAPVVSRSLRIGVARDQAFCFYYAENLRLLERAGARLVPFRPCDGDGVPSGVAGLYLGGGYPELHATRLSGNTAFLDGIRQLHQAGTPIYAECGGFMTLCQGLTDANGAFHPMAGLYPARTEMNRRAFRLGYREVRTAGAAGTELTLRGHEFHYSHVSEMPAEVTRRYRVTNARSEPLPAEGYQLGNTLAGYIHLHFGSCPEFPLGLFGLTPPR